MLLATREDFEPTPEERDAALYTSYERYTFFQRRIDELKGRFAPNGQKLAVWGCGFGHLVDLAVQAGYDAFGFDASSYAIDRGKTLLPGIASRLFVRNALVAGDMTPARRDAGLVGNQRFPLLVTEDMLTCLTDAEIPTAVANLRGISTTNLLHIVWPLLPDHPERDPRVTWKTILQWLSLVAPPDFVYDAEHHRVFSAAGEVL